jgi:hypothetical protein
MAGAFIWMRCWQSVAVNRLLTLAGTREPIRWTARRVARLVAQQAFVQPSAFVVLPVAALVVLPFGWTYAFYQNFLVDGCGEEGPVRRLMARSAAGTCAWPGQNHSGLGLLSLLYGVAFINALSLLWLAPRLLKTGLGVETAFSRNQFSFLNTTVLAIAAGIAYLGVGPVVKAFYVLRCFYGSAVRTGEDLKVGLRRLRTTAVCLLVLGMALAGVPARAAVDAKALDASISQELTRPEFAWRMPREARGAADEAHSPLLVKFSGAVTKALKAAWVPCRKGLSKCLHWLLKHAKLDRPESPPLPGTQWATGIERTLYGLCGLILLVAAYLGWQAWKRRGAVATVEAETVDALPDLRSEEVMADQLPEDRWIELAREMAGKGDYRLSLRALYLAGLAHLGKKELITIAKAKTNADFRRELDRRARAETDLLAAFGESVHDFERVWYGTGEATPEGVERYSVNLQRIIAC